MKPLLLGILLFAALALPVLAAAPETLTPDAAFEQLRSYDYGQSERPLRVIELYVVRTATDAAQKARVAERLGTILADAKTTPAARTFCCQQLLVVGGEAQVPLVARMLDDPQTAELARFTLQALPGEAAVAAIRGALDRWKGRAEGATGVSPVPGGSTGKMPVAPALDPNTGKMPVAPALDPNTGKMPVAPALDPNTGKMPVAPGPLVGAINSLGIRRDAKAVDTLAKLLADADPQVAAAAAEALGKIATPDAAAALLGVKVPAKAAVALDNAQLQCAERSAADNKKALAADICSKIWSSDRPVAQRLGGLVGLAKVDPEKAKPAIFASLTSSDRLVQATAMRLAGTLPDGAAITAIEKCLPHLDSTAKILLLANPDVAEDVVLLSERILKRLIEDQDESVRIAAVKALGLGNCAQAPLLAHLAAESTGAVQQAARQSLARLSDKCSDAMLGDELAHSKEKSIRAEAIRALGTRGTFTVARLIEAMADPEKEVRGAAMEAISGLRYGRDYPQLIEWFAKLPPVDAASAEHAVSSVADRLGDSLDCAAPVISALDDPATRAKPSLLRILGGLGGEKALKAVRSRLTDGDAEVRDAAVRAMAGWPDASAGADLLAVAQSAEKNTHRVLALRGYLRLAGEEKNQANRLAMLQRVRPIATTVAAKRMLLSALAEAADAGALHVAAEMLDDAEVQAEAAAAALKIARAVLRTDPAAVRTAMKRLTDTTKDKTVAEQAAAMDDEALHVPSPEAVEQALRHDPKRSEAQKALLAKSAPKGYHLAGYLDCGPDAVDGRRGGPMLRLVVGTPYNFGRTPVPAEPRLATVFYDGQRVVFEAAGLDPKRSYQLGFAWWDIDHDTRCQSVLAATGGGERETKLLDATRLPSGVKGEKAVEKTLTVPTGLYADGSLRIAFRNESQPNVVVSEIWIWESDGK
jgi:HEAT repeat protein